MSYKHITWIGSTWIAFSLDEEKTCLQKETNVSLSLETPGSTTSRNTASATVLENSGLHYQLNISVPGCRK